MPTLTAVWKFRKISSKSSDVDSFPWSYGLCKKRNFITDTLFRKLYPQRKDIFQNACGGLLLKSYDSEKSLLEILHDLNFIVNRETNFIWSVITELRKNQLFLGNIKQILERNSYLFMTSSRGKCVYGNINITQRKISQSWE